MLEPGEGMTVAVAWKKGLINPPSLSFFGWIALHRELSYAGVILVIFLYYFLQRWRLLRHPNMDASIIPLFSPPEGMSPGYMAALWEKKYTGRILHADIVWAAVNGFLRIEVKDKKTIILHRKDSKKKLAQWIYNQCSTLSTRLTFRSEPCNLKSNQGRRNAADTFEHLVKTYHTELEHFWNDSILSKALGWIILFFAWGW